MTAGDGNSQGKKVPRQEGKDVTLAQRSTVAFCP